MKRTIKVGIIQQTCTNDIRHNLSKLHHNIEQVAAAGAQLVVLQELHNTPYFCQTEDTDMFDLAEPVPGPSTGLFPMIPPIMRNSILLPVTWDLNLFRHHWEN